MKAKVIAVALHKGGIAKTTTSSNLAFGLALEGKKVLLIDSDPQGSLSISLGIQVPDNLDLTLATLMNKIISDEEISFDECKIKRPEFDFIPSNLDLSDTEYFLFNAMCRETILRQYIKTQQNYYDFIIIDCPSNLGMITINALSSADSIIIPVQAELLPAKALSQLFSSIKKARKVNPKLEIEGILVTMVDNRTNFAKEVSKKIKEEYGKLNVFANDIPRSIKVAEASAAGQSLYKYCPQNGATLAYRELTKEVIRNEKIRQRKRSMER